MAKYMANYIAKYMCECVSTASLLSFAYALRTRLGYYTDAVAWLT